MADLGVPGFGVVGVRRSGITASGYSGMTQHGFGVFKTRSKAANTKHNEAENLAVPVEVDLVVSTRSSGK